MSGLRRNKSSCGSGQYDAFMFGKSTGFGVENSAQPMAISMNTMSQPSPANYSYPAPNKTVSMNDASTAGVRECMYWPASLNKNQQQMQQYQQQISYPTRGSPNSNAGPYSSGDAPMFCAAPPKVYMSVPGINGKKAQMTQQNIPCQIAPLGTDPMSMIKPLAPLTVRVQAPPDLFTGNSDEPKTISISPAQLYGTGRVGQR